MTAAPSLSTSLRFSCFRVNAVGGRVSSHFLMEKIFGLVSSTRLQDLADPNNKLLRILAQKAPGTFQHSLQVMNLSDAAARSIDANVLLVRAGAMYHDIGKTEILSASWKMKASARNIMTV